jgi:hypothetical protein
MAPLQATLTAQPVGTGALSAASTTSSVSADSSVFNMGSSSFVPKSKQTAATTQSAPATTTDFPTLGDASASQKKKGGKQVAVKEEPVIEDPSFGKPKEFFIYEFDQSNNVCICNAEQLTFIAIHYSEHYFSPIDILIWLYDVAEYKESEADRREMIDENPYGPPKRKGVPVTNTKATIGTGKKATKKVVEEDYDENEDSTFGMSYKDLKKKKPTMPTKPAGVGAGGKQLTDAQKEEQRK